MYYMLALISNEIAGLGSEEMTIIKKSGVGVIALNHKGQFIVVCSGPLTGSFDPETAEALALQRAVLLHKMKDSLIDLRFRLPFFGANDQFEDSRLIYWLCCE